MGEYYFKCNTLKDGKVIIFDYKLNECIKMGDDLILAYKNRKMIVPHAELKTRALEIDKRIQPSKFGKPYKVYHFKWEPIDDEEINSKQQKLI